VLIYTIILLLWHHKQLLKEIIASWSSIHWNLTSSYKWRVLLCNLVPEMGLMLWRLWLRKEMCTLVVTVESRSSKLTILRVNIWDTIECVSCTCLVHYWVFDIILQRLCSTLLECHWNLGLALSCSKLLRAHQRCHRLRVCNSHPCLTTCILRERICDLFLHIM